MKYQITLMIKQDGKFLPRMPHIINSDVELTAKEVKEQCLSVVTIEKFKVKSEELTLGNTWKTKDPVADDFILSQANGMLNYTIELESK